MIVIVLWALAWGSFNRGPPSLNIGGLDVRCSSLQCKAEETRSKRDKAKALLKRVFRKVPDPVQAQAKDTFRRSPEHIQSVVKSKFRGSQGRAQNIPAPPASEQPSVISPSLPLTFAQQPASQFELTMVSCIRAREGEWRARETAALDSGWFDRLTDWDVLRYIRACTGGGIGEEVEEVAEAVRIRLLATARWRSEREVDALLTRNEYEMGSFFDARKSGEAAPQGGEPAHEVEWLAGRDSFGRPVAVFYADRHTPGEIPLSDWEEFVIYSAEAAVAKYALARGPGGQFSLIVDRSSSGLRNQDVSLALSILPTIQEHYPGLLGRVFVAPVNDIFYVGWSVVKLFLKPRTIEKFALLRGKDYRTELKAAIGGDVHLPAHMMPTETT